MKWLITYLSLQVFSCHLFAQLDPTSKQLVYQVFKEEQGTDTITYTDKPSKRAFELIRQAFQKDTIRCITYRESCKMEFYVSKQERRYVMQSIRKMKTIKWDSSLFPVSRMIAADSMWSYIRTRTRVYFQMLEEKRKARDTTVKYNLTRMVLANNVFTFAPPIFLKNNTLAIFYFLRMCGPECGVEDLAVYRLKDGKYERWFFINGGVF